MPRQAGENAATDGTVRPMEARSAQSRTSIAPRPINSARRGWLAAGQIGHLAPIALTTSIGLLLCSLANALSRATLSPSQLIFWAGLVTIAGPIAYRLTSREASGGERLALVCLLGLSLYAIKVIRDAPLYTFSDEILHAFNANQAAGSGHLFHRNEILPVTPFYPGLEGATTALMKLSGLSSFGAGVLVVGAARLMLMVALFLLFGRISGSTRTAGLGVAIYAGNFNFLYFGAQYSYEFLALPLLVVVMMAVAEREAGAERWAREWVVPVVLGTIAIVVTHHLTSYALVAVLVALALGYRFLRRTWSWANPWRLAAFAAVAAVVWLLLVASSTLGYLTPVLGEAFKSIYHTLFGQEASRGLFQGERPPGEATPTWARGLALFAVVLLGVGMLFGLRRIWQRHRRSPFALILALAALGFFGTLALRFTPAAWETGNRASEFLFIGLAFVVALAGFETWRPRIGVRAWRLVLSAAVAIVIMGGAISGWPWEIQLALPLKARAEGHTITSPTLSLAEWAADNTSPSARFAASPADARMLMVPGGRTAFAGQSPDIEDILNSEGLSGWELPLLRENHIRYLVADNREISDDAISGYFFPIRGEPRRNARFPRANVAKYGEIEGAARVYSNGPIAVYDLAGSSAMRGHRDLVFASGAALACAGLALLPPLTALRVFFALPLCLLLPGYAITAAAFARQPLQATQTAALSLALSLATLALGALVLNYLGGLHAGSWALLLVAVVLAACRLAAVRRPQPGLAPRLELKRPPLARLALYGIALVAAVVAVGLAFVPLPAKNAIGHTELSIATGGNGPASVIQLRVRSQEQHSASYFLRVRIGRTPRPVIRLFDLVPGEERTIRVDVPTPARTTTTTVSLFRQSDPERVYRRVYSSLPGREA